MPNEKQDLTNHRQVAVACKNYTDTEIKKSEERILSIVARNNVDFIDHINEATYRFTAPANSKLLMLQSIAGNSNKIAPSTPSDDSVARLKVIPENTYKSQVNYIGGKTVKYNQLIQNSNFVDSTGWLVNATFGTSSVANNKLTYTITTKNASQSIATASGYRTDIISGHKYFLSGTFTISQNATVSFEFDASTTINTFGNVNANTRTTLTTIKEISISTTNKGLYFYPNYSGGGLEVGATAIFENIILIDLTDKFGAGNEPSTVETAIPLLKANGYKLDGTDTYSTGSLKHAIVSGVKYESDNIIGLQDIAQTTENGITYKVENNTITFNGTATGGTNLYIEIAELTLNGDYTYKEFQSGTASGGYARALRYGTTNVQNLTYSPITFNQNNAVVNRYLFYIPTGTSFTNYQIQIMLVKGTTAPSTYIPYVAPITKAIPSQVLADVRYGLGFDNTNYNHLDSDGHLRGSYAIIDLSTLNYTYDSDNVFIAQINSLGIKTSNPNCICSKYNYIGQTYQSNLVDKSFIIAIDGLTIRIKDTNYTDAQTFKTAMSGVYLVYELETSFDQDYSQYFTDGWNKVDLDNLYASCEMVCDEPIDMPNKVEYYGTIIHSLATAVKQDGFNIWDEQKELGGYDQNTGAKTSSSITYRNVNPIAVNPSTEYYIKKKNGDAGFVYYYDNNMNYISASYRNTSTTFTTPSNCYFINFTSMAATWENETCINISNQDLNGTYKPHKATITRLLPNSEAKYSWGITTGVRNTRVFCDDECNPVNEGQLDVGNQDLGLLNYTYESSYSTFKSTISDIYNNLTRNILCYKYETSAVSNWENMNDKEIAKLGTNSTTIMIKDTIMGNNSTIFKNAMSGVPFFYPKNTTDTETLDDFDYFFDCEEGDTFTIIGCELLQCYATYSFLIKEAKSNE